MRATDFQLELPPAVRRTLGDVRRRIRAYVLVEGLALLVALLGIAFWVGFAWDWLFEPTPAVRRVALIAIAVAALLVVYRYLLRRLFVPISDASAALLLERRFPELGEHLLTTVDLASRQQPLHDLPELASQTQRAAVEALVGVRPSALFRRGPLVRAVAIAGLLLCGVGAFAVVSRGAFNFWLQRIALSDTPWPRRVSLSALGFEPDAHGLRVHKLAQDDDYELLVEADALQHEVPREVEIRYRLADGRRGRDTMIRVGEAVPGRDASQPFRYEFKRVGGNMTFDIVGGDDRIRDLELRVVDRPALFALELECTYPGYLRRESQRLPVTGGMRIPEGTHVVLHAKATKPLTAARIQTSRTQQDANLEFADRPHQELRWEYGTLTDDEALLVNVTDADNVTAREPYRVSLAVVRDEVPQVAVRLAGIGSAITPDAILPVAGKITDDYGLGRVWFEYTAEGMSAAARPLVKQPEGDAELTQFDSFDLRELDATTGQRVLTLQPGQRFTLSLKASDRFDLSPAVSSLPDDDPQPLSSSPHGDDVPGAAGQPLHAGSSQVFALDVVTMPELLALLERRELQLRQQYEAIYGKMTDTRNTLARVEFGDEAADTTEGAANPTSETAAKSQPSPAASENESAETADAAGQRALARRRLRVAGSQQNVVQAADEVSGVADAFDELHEQLTNNRIDNPSLKSRLAEQIARPLHQVGEQRMPQLAAQLELLGEHVQDAEGPAALASSLALADEILVEMRAVLDRMLELETYNEVVAQLRGIIQDQQEINRQTKQRQRDRLRNLLDDEE